MAESVNIKEEINQAAMQAVLAVMIALRDPEAGPSADHCSES